MYVYDLRLDTFDKLADDLLGRLGELKEPPRVFVAIGNSGGHVAKAIAKHAVRNPRGLDAHSVRIVELGWNAVQQTHTLRDETDAKLISESPLLLIDSVVNSGATMMDAIRLVSRYRGSSASDLITYAVAVRLVAETIPNFFAYSIGVNDRVFMPWHPSRPNNRMSPHGVFRRLSESDFDRPAIRSKQDFINRAAWTDRWYQARADASRHVIVCERQGTIASFINFTIDVATRELHVDEIATDVDHEGRGLAGALLRYAETMARGSGCTHMTLWSHADVVQYYQKIGFVLLGRSIACGRDGDFHLMEHALGSSKNQPLGIAQRVA